MPPHPLASVDLAEGVMQEDIGCAGRVGTGIISHHRIEPEQGLDQVALEPGIEIIARGLREQVEHRVQGLCGKPPDAVAEAARFH